VDRLHARFVDSAAARLISRLIPRRLSAALADYSLRNAFIVRRLVLDRWFLRSRESALVAAR
jgi:hypothetical protein